MFRWRSIGRLLNNHSFQRPRFQVCQQLKDGERRSSYLTNRNRSTRCILPLLPNIFARQNHRRFFTTTSTPSAAITSTGPFFQIGRRFQHQHNRYQKGNNMSSDKTVQSPVYGGNGDWDIGKRSADSFVADTAKLIDECRAVYDRVAAVPEDQVNYNNVVQALADVQCEYSTRRSALEFPQHAAVDKAIRDASTEAARKLQEFDVEMSMRKEVFDKVQHFASRELDGLEAEARRYVQRLVTNGKRSGLHLSEDTRAQIETVKKRMSELCITFQSNLNEDSTELHFDENELEGLPEDFIRSLDKLPSDKLRVTLKYPHFYPIVRKASNEQTRFKMETAYHSRCMTENAPLLEELVELRQKHADLLGYPTHAAYVMELLMAKTPETVATFLDELAVKLKPLWEKEQVIMLEFKKQECEDTGRAFDGKLNYWDCRYYMAMVEEKLYAVEQNSLKEYFPLKVVTDGLFKIYQDLLGLRFIRLENAPVWHPDVSMYKVEDGSNEGLLMGYFFLDLFPREGKYGHAAVFCLEPGCCAKGGERQVAVAAMMANFTKPNDEKPSLLDHKEVETYFHEFGHVMHQVCARATFSMFAGTRVERDFVEAPSQMLQNWVWEAAPLRLMSAHHVNGTPLPDEIVDRLVQSQMANAGIFNLRQIALATFDQRMHTRAKADSRSLFNDTFEEITGIAPIPGTNMSASFGHLAGGYDSQYYGYLWSEVFSMDMFYSRFKEEGIMNSVTGREYRRCILQPGGSLDGSEMLQNFLGRKPEMAAFLRSKGLN